MSDSNIRATARTTLQSDMKRCYNSRAAITSAYPFARKSQTVHDIPGFVRSPVCSVRGPAMTFVAVALIVTPSVGCLVDILVARGVVCRGDYSDGMLVARFDRK